MECAFDSRRLVALVIVFVLIPCLADKGSIVAAQDLPVAEPDVAVAAQPPVGTFDGTMDQGNAQQDARADSADPGGSQNPPADRQTDQDLNRSPSNENGKYNFVHDIVGDFFHDEYRIWTAPFRGRSYDTHSMKKYGVPFLLISAALIASDRQTANWLPNTTTQVVWSGRVSQVGAPYTMAGFSAATYLIGRTTHNDHLRESGFLALEAVADSEFVALILKEATQRQRPLQGVQHGGFWEGGTSFPSGHAAGSFAVASVFAYEYRDHLAIPITAYALATVVDVSRLSARQHWLSDIFVGSALGFMSGRYVYKQHHDPSLPGTITSKLRPQVDARQQGFGLYWDF